MIGRVGHDSCPAPDVLGAFAAGTLDGLQRKEVASHVAYCPECPFVVGETARFLREDRVREPKRRAGQRWLWAAAAIAAVCIPAIVWRLREERDPLRQLQHVASQLPSRSVEGRLDGFTHTPFVALRSGGGSEPGLAIRAEAARLAERDDRSASSLHARGIALLLTGDPADAVKLLDASVRAEPAEASSWNDLATADIALATLGDRDSLRPALRAAERAIELSPHSAAPHFNRAVALEHLGLRRDAARAYQHALILEPSPAWRREIRERIDLLPR
ncbi:MAG: tetratricopeptide repeat protein [Acidobacteria bacterium]|nr:tetratricopeptide repeat protein [Acidobacteriota bacterium]